mgnify:CR=1 FL=1
MLILLLCPKLSRSLILSHLFSVSSRLAGIQARETGGFVDTLSSHYVFALGGYRALYLLNWIYRLCTEKGYSNWIVWIAGLVQTAIYCDFFWYYLKAQIDGTKMSLPM